MGEKIDFKKLGLKVGLELHQQLNTKHKLFCKCPTKLVEEKGEFNFIRRLRPTRSELGEVDIAALFEWKRGRYYLYESYDNYTCLVEGDEEPPHELNREALEIALTVALLLNSKPVDEVHVMRKIVIDGSNTTGFQRTAVVALGGYLEDEEDVIRIQTICLEEDAARKIAEKGAEVTYRLDRLGIPLIEIATGPDIHTPEQAERVAYKIGQLLRITGKVKRGLGTIRQDLNISIEGGEKIEVKGVQKLELISRVVAYEALRQYRLLKIRDGLKKRGLREEDIAFKPIDVTKIFEKTKSKVLRRALKERKKILAQVLPYFKGILGIELQPKRRFGTELAEYAKFWGGVSGIIHTDELPRYGITDSEIRMLYEYCKADPEKDAIVIVADREDNAREALKAIVERAKYALKGVPKETRAANPDGTTRYMRPQPGAARMYPETDVPPIEVTEEWLEKIREKLPEKPEQKYEKFVREYGLSKDLARLMIKSYWLDLFEKLVEKFKGKVSPVLIATTFENTLKALKGEGIPIENIRDEVFEEILEKYSEKTMAKEAIPKILAWIARNPGKTVEEAIKVLKIERLTLRDVEAIVEEIIKDKRELIKARRERAFGAIMGLAMSKLRGKVDGKTVAEIVKKKINEYLRNIG